MIVKTGVPFKCPIGRSEMKLDCGAYEVAEWRSQWPGEKRLSIEETRF